MPWNAAVVLVVQDWGSILKELGTLAGGLGLVGAGIALIVKVVRFWDKSERTAAWVEKYGEPLEDLAEGKGCNHREPEPGTRERS